MKKLIGLVSLLLLLSTIGCNSEKPLDEFREPVMLNRHWKDYYYQKYKDRAWHHNIFSENLSEHNKIRLVTSGESYHILNFYLVSVEPLYEWKLKNPPHQFYLENAKNVKYITERGEICEASLITISLPGLLYHNERLTFQQYKFNYLRGEHDINKEITIDVYGGKED